MTGCTTTWIPRNSFSVNNQHSVLSCLLKCANDWYLNLEGGKYTAVTFVDLKKAFDTVNHEMSLQKTSALRYS